MAFFSRSKETCPDCETRQWSAFDRNYLAEYGTCWACDKKRFENHELTLDEFEERERKAFQPLNDE